MNKKERERLSDKQLENFKGLLLKELSRLEDELATVGARNPNDPEDWEARPDDMDVMQADKSEVADKKEEYVDNASILNELEIRLNQVKRALDKIEAGTYGTCEVGGDRIPLRRLEANPAAMTCVDHAGKLYG